MHATTPQLRVFILAGICRERIDSIGIKEEGSVREEEEGRRDFFSVSKCIAVLLTNVLALASATAQAKRAKRHRRRQHPFNPRSDLFPGTT
jgi:hypothetical protein